MRRRRQQKLERKLQLFRSKDGGPDTGGTLKVNISDKFRQVRTRANKQDRGVSAMTHFSFLFPPIKIYGESLCRDVPYKTLLLSVRETAAYVVREMLDKYALNREDPANYCLVQVSLLYIFKIVS